MRQKGRKRDKEIDKKYLMSYTMEQLYYSIEQEERYVNTYSKKKDIRSLFESPL